MTDETKKAAVVVNEQGHALSIYRHPSGSVWANFSLSSSSLDQLSPQKPPIFRIDKNEAHDVGAEKRLQEMGLGVQAFDWEPKWMNFVIWHGKESEGRSKKLNELMQGRIVIFRYYIFTGGYKETRFSLDGAGTTIAEALAIPLEVDRAISARQEEFKNVYVGAIESCKQDITKFQTCFERVFSCKRQAKNDVATFQQCLQ